MKKIILFLLICLPLFVNAQDLDIHLGDSLTKLMPILKTEQELLHIKYYHTIVNINKVIVDVDHIPDGVEFAGLQVLTKKYIFYKFRLEKALLVLDKGDDNIDISKSITYKYGKSKASNENNEMWVTSNMLVFLYDKDNLYCITYVDRALNAKEIKNRSSDL